MNKEIILPLLDQQLSLAKIAEILNVSEGSIKYWCKKYNLKITKPGLKKNKITCVICDKEINRKNSSSDKCWPCWTSIRRIKVKLAIVKYKGGKCADCNWSGEAQGYDLHHVDDSKEFNLASGYYLDLSKIKAEIEKCILLCSRCHRLRHISVRSDSFMLAVQEDPIDFNLVTSDENQVLKKIVCRTCKVSTVYKKGNNCKECSSKSSEKVQWPADEILVSQVNLSSIAEVSRNLQVSFNTVKKRYLKAKRRLKLIEESKPYKRDGALC